MTVRCRQFSAGFISRKRAMDEVCAFVEGLGRERLITICHDWGAILVYYWE